MKKPPPDAPTGHSPMDYVEYHQKWARDNNVTWALRTNVCECCGRSIYQKEVKQY